MPRTALRPDAQEARLRNATTLLLLCLIATSSHAQAASAPIPVAHRGLLLDAPENTMATIHACLQLRVGFELDVRRSKDGQLVCIHDETVDRTTDGHGQISELTLAQLRALDAGSWFDRKFRGERIPTLDEVFTAISHNKSLDVLVAVDVKGQDEKIESDIVELAIRHGVLDRLLMIGRTISNADVRRRFLKADLSTNVACVANTSKEFDAALGDQAANWVYVRYVPSREEVAKVHAESKQVFIAGPTVAGPESENWRVATMRGVDAILTDYAPKLSRQIRRDNDRMATIKAKLEPHYSPPAEFRGDYGKYPSPLKFADGTQIETATQWQRRRQNILQQWHKRMGPWPDLLRNPRVKFLTNERRENFTQHRVHVEIYSGDEFTEGHLLVPDGKGPFPAALVTFYDSATSAGLGERGHDTHDYGLQLVRRGFVTLSIGTPGSIGHPDKKTRDLLTDAGERQGRQPLSYLAYVAANCHTALATMPSVDAERIGVVGLSYGGKWSMFASCLYDKFNCAVWSDPGIVFNESNSNVNYWEPWYLGYEKGVRRQAGVPNKDRPRTGLYKQLIESNQDLNELHALICPRPVLVAGGTEDPPQNWRALNHVVTVNKILGHANRVAMTQRQTHVPTPEALEKTLMFLEYHLKYKR